MSRGGICMRFWVGSTSNWLKIYDHVSKLRDDSLFQTKISEIAQNSNKNSIRDIDYFEYWANLKLSHLKISCICLHVTIPPSMTLWAISRTPAYTSSTFIILKSVRVLHFMFRNHTCCSSCRWFEYRSKKYNSFWRLIWISNGLVNGSHQRKFIQKSFYK